MEIHVANLCAEHSKISLLKLKQAVSKMLKSEKKIGCGVNIVICNDKKILELNRRFRQISKPTDVLAFPFNDSDLLGEIYISVDTAIRQAEKIGHTLEKELKRLVVHGTAHLLGYTHKTKRDRVKMETIESVYFK